MINHYQLTKDDTHLLILIAIAFYTITWVQITRCVKANIDASDKTAHANKMYFITWVIALAAHLLTIIITLSDSNGISVNLVSLISNVMWFISLILFITTLNRKIHALAVIILPFTLFSLIALIASGSDTNNSIPMNSGLGLHISVSLLAYSTLMLAAVQAFLLATQNNYLHQRLKNPNQSNFVRTLPALEDMEYFLFHLIAVGVLLLSISLLSGFYYLDNLFGSNVAHKTILSLISWIIFAGLLLGRWRYGWRGKTAVRWTISGFAVLALAFFGSKIIQEFVITKEVSFYHQEHHQNTAKETPPTFYGVFTYNKSKSHATDSFSYIPRSSPKGTNT